MARAATRRQRQTVGHVGRVWIYRSGYDSWAPASLRHGREEVLHNCSRPSYLGSGGGDASVSEYLEPIKGALEVAALACDPLASVCLGRMYAQGLGCERNPMHAYAWFRWAAKRCSAGNVHDEANDGYQFFHSLLSPRERKDSEEWLDALARRRVCDPAEPTNGRTT